MYESVQKKKELNERIAKVEFFLDKVYLRKLTFYEDLDKYRYSSSRRRRHREHQARNLYHATRDNSSINS